MKVSSTLVAVRIHVTSPFDISALKFPFRVRMLWHSHWTFRTIKTIEFDWFHYLVWIVTFIWLIWFDFPLNKNAAFGMPSDAIIGCIHCVPMHLFWETFNFRQAITEIAFWLLRGTSVRCQFRVRRLMVLQMLEEVWLIMRNFDGWGHFNVLALERFLWGPIGHLHTLIPHTPCPNDPSGECVSFDARVELEL